MLQFNMLKKRKVNATIIYTVDYRKCFIHYTTALSGSALTSARAHTHLYIASKVI